MKDNCFDIGIIQTFVDGELSSSRTEEVVRHLSVCDSCAMQVAEVESENDSVFATLGTELDYMVPTERLREKVFAAISEDSNEAVFVGSQRSSWFTGFQALLTGRLATAMGALVICFAAFGSLMYYSDLGNDAQMASVDAPDGSGFEVTSAEIPNDEYLPQAVSETTSDDQKNVPTPQALVVRQQPKQKMAVKAVARTRDQNVKAINAVAGNRAPRIEAEPGYLQTIATLNRTVDRSKDYVLNPSERIEFERNLAVVNNAITRMKSAIRKDPKNEGAKAVLNASYKSKIDLLSSVANRDDSVTTLD